MYLTSSAFTKKVTSALFFTGFLVGVIIGAGALSGDELGRVNLLFFLFLFALVPILSLVVSAILLLTKKNGIASLIITSPLWPKALALHSVQQELIGSKRNWLFLQSQIMVLAFAFGGLVVFVALLLGTDVNFVWRSTLLDAQALQPVLQAIALPWLFWSDAQPTLDLLELSRNSRITTDGSGYSASWWKFAIAAQITYNLIPRIVLLLIAAWRYRQDAVANSVENLVNSMAKARHFSADTPPPLAEIAYTTPSEYQLANWADAPDFCLSFITKSFGSAKTKLSLNPLTATTTLAQTTTQTSLVVIVKSWEPPLAELQDVLKAIANDETNFILPLDWNETQVVPTQTSHLTEWRRFAATLINWKILLPGTHS